LPETSRLGEHFVVSWKELALMKDSVERAALW